MNKNQFEKLKTEFLDKGYGIWKQHLQYEDYFFGKSFHKTDNKWEDNRAAYQVLIFVYDYSDRPEFWDGIPEALRDRVGLEVHIDVSRTINEKVDMIITWHDDSTIEEIEDIAEHFYQWVCRTWPEPREEKPIME